MADYTWETVVTERKRFILETPWPAGAAIGELYKMLAAVEQELGPDNRYDDRAWVICEDDRLVVYIDRDKPRKE